MNILLVSESFMVREGMENLFKNEFNSVHVKAFSRLSELKIIDFLDIDFTFIDMKQESVDNLKIIGEAKQLFTNLRAMVLDLNRDKDIFKKVIDFDIEGYVLSICEKEELIYEINKILKGRKVYEADLLKSVMNDSGQDSISILTTREREVMNKVADGLNNKDIAKVLFITESTVKKHVSSILYKLNLRNRKEVIILCKKK
ncbi:response regulator transcription factor [Clostridium peptidivorans]|uniref:response regulator transcription factor n=1 Tax=Clostridium peptidivorans TaxID=100174 RepID=UPI000BE39338|nr:response regulator transcription factor [Clostridium peptidivorans]